MKKLVTLCFLICSAISVYPQTQFGGSVNGANVTNAAQTAAKQMQYLTSGNPSAQANLSQLQLLGLDPVAVQKYLKEKSDASKLGLGEGTDMMQMVMDMKSQQDLMQSKMDSIYNSKPNSDVKPNEIFGHDFFGTGRLALFSKSSDSKAPDSYILGVGDEINIAVWGSADYNNKFLVSDDGHIQIPEFGRIYVKGLTFGAVKAQIGKRLSTFINPSNTQYEITLNYSRTIDVNIVGEVKSPGTYQIPAINSVYNAINAANGITDIGSVRDIQVRRDGKTIKRFDVYEFLFNPLLQENFFLQKGDFIYVSTQSRLIKIAGAVRRPAKYELFRGENLNELIKFSGGFAPDAYVRSVQIARINNDKSQIIDVDYEQIMSSNSNFELKDGDVVTISTIPGGIENAVSITGSLRYPGKYELKEGYRVSDVIKVAGGLRGDTYLDRAYIKRKLDDNTYVNQKFSLKDILIDESSPDNLLLKRGDQIQLFSKDEFLEKFFISIEGSVIKPTTMEFTDGISLNDLLFYAGGLKVEAANSKIEISRLMYIDSVGLEKYTPQREVVQTITIGPNLELDDVSKSFRLAPMDRVYVRKIYGFNEPMSVTIKGEVRYPGVYPILDKNEKVLDLIERAGGLTPYAYIKNARLSRPENGLTQTYFQLNDAFADSASRSNLIVKNGDVIEIPTVNQLVSIKGAIRYPNMDSTQTISGKFVSGKSARWYIRHYAGGFKKKAKKNSTMVIYPNRKLDYTHSFMGIKNFPTVDYEGALITVDMKNKKPKPPKGPESALNWNIVLPSVIAAFTSLATTLTLVLLLSTP